MQTCKLLSSLALKVKGHCQRCTILFNLESIKTHRPPTVKIFLRTPKFLVSLNLKIFLKSSNLRTFLRTGWRQHTTIGCNTHCKTTQKCTSLHFVDRINRSGSQGQGQQSLGQNNTEFNFFARVPQQYTRLPVFRFFQSTWVQVKVFFNLRANFGL